MANTAEQLVTRLRNRFADKLDAVHVYCGQVAVEIAADSLLEIGAALRDESEFHFEQLSDLCGVDYSAYGQADWLTEEATTSGFSRSVRPSAYTEKLSDRPHFAVAYQLLSVKNNQRLRVRVFAPGEPPRVPSVVDLWSSANWYEREAFDLFGILFDGHPDLRRILTDYGFIGHPFRKDFPLNGNVEVRYDPDKGRVVYQPVTIENRVLVPRVIRRDKTVMAKPGEEEASNA